MRLVARLATSALLAVSALPATRAADAAACPADRVVKLDADAWASRARAATTRAQLDAALAEVKLPPVAEEIDYGLAPQCDGPGIARVHVDAFRAQLRDDGPPARVLQVLAGVCGPAWQLQRGVVLVPLDAGRWCRVDAPFLVQSGSGWNDLLCGSTTFGFEKVVSAARVAVKVTEQHDWCGSSGSARGSSTDVSWWELQGFSLEKLLQVTTAEAFYHSPTPPIRTTSTATRLVGDGYPKQLELVERVACDDPGYDDDESAVAEFRACKPGKTRRVCSYDGRAYACAPAR